MTMTNPIEQKIRSFKKLKIVNGSKISDVTIENALDIHKHIVELNFAETGAFPGGNSEIRLTIYHLNHYIEFDVIENDIDGFAYEKDNKDVYDKDKMSISELRLKLKEIRREID